MTKMLPPLDIDINALAALSRDELVEIARAACENAERVDGNRIAQLFPADGDRSRHLYRRHMDFFRAGSRYRERCFLAANRVGKTVAGAYEVALHLTGRYPDWWDGRRFDGPVRAWAAGKTNETTRDIIQRTLLGPVISPGSARKSVSGTGLIPKAAILNRPTWKTGVADLVDTIAIGHVSGGVSTLGLKSYQQGRGIFEGTAQHVIWLDEEPPLDVYGECLIRTATTNGVVLLTFTPLDGLSDVVLAFLPVDKGGTAAEAGTSRNLTQAGWDDVPHLDADTKRELLASTPPYLRDARSKGMPALGSGAVYPVAESDIVVDPFQIPAYWPKAYGLDVGWNRTAAVWAAWDRGTDTVYLYTEHYRGQAEPSVHAAAIKARGAWIPGAIDPAARGRQQSDGDQLLQMYREHGLNVEPAKNSVESGLYEVWERLSTGRLKVFSTCTNWLSEYRLYRRDERGRIVKERDHLMDATRYLIVSGLVRATVEKQSSGHRTASVGDPSCGY